MSIARRSQSRRRFLKGAGATAAGTLAAPFVGRIGSAAAAWPERPVKIVAPFAAGGPTDVIARIVAAGLQEAFGGSAFVVENKGGAGGNIGIGAVAQAAPDGYTLLISSSAFVLNPSLYAKIPYDPHAFEPIADLGTSTNVFVARPDLGVKSIADLVALARKDPDKLNYGSPGIGTTPMLSFELLKVREKIQAAQVVHAGAAPAVQALLAGTVPVACVALPPAQPHIQAGKLVGLAVTGEKRWIGLPEVPTMLELGYKDFVLETAQLFLAPPGTPKAVVDKLATASIEILKRPETTAKLNAAGFDVNARGPAELKARIAKEVPMLKEIVTQAGVKPR